jgi:hypothetical protein
MRPDSVVKYIRVLYASPISHFYKTRYEHDIGGHCVLKLSTLQLHTVVTWGNTPESSGAVTKYCTVTENLWCLKFKTDIA